MGEYVRRKINVWMMWTDYQVDLQHETPVKCRVLYRALQISDRVGGFDSIFELFSFCPWVAITHFEVLADLGEFRNLCGNCGP